MSRDYLKVLQISEPKGEDQLKNAYKLSQARYLRLTRRGPLKFYRHDLLQETEQAYRELKKAIAADALAVNPYRKTAYLKNSPSVLARQAALEVQAPAVKNTVRSAVKTGTILSSAPWKLKARSLNYLRHNTLTSSPAAETKVEERRRALIEDEFCREVIYRLEGDMIRYDSRRELLQIAEDKGLNMFRANMLMAQIVESVRQNKLYEPTGAELQLLKGQKVKAQSRARRLRVVLAGVILGLAVVIDVWVIRYLSK